MNNSVEDKFTRLAGSIEPSAGFSQELWSKMKNQSMKKSSPKTMPRRLWIPAAALLAALLVVVVATPQGVLAAFRSLLSYIPGVGFVQTDDATLYLVEPVTVEKDGFIFTLDQVVADAEKVVVAYHIDAIDKDVSSCFYDANHLILPDGKSNMPIGGGVQGNVARVEFFPLPEGVTGASILASMDVPSEGCGAPQEWNVSFTLGTTAPETEILPVMENVATQAPLPTDGSSVQMVVDKMVELSDGYLLTGHITAADKNWQNVNIDLDTISAIDANGKNVKVIPSDESWSDNEFSLKVATKEFTGPVTFDVKDLWIWANTEDPASFTFETGIDPKAGQTWTIDQELTVAGLPVRVLDVEMVEDNSHTNVPGTLYGYSVHIASENLNSAGLNCFGQDSPQSLFGQTMPLDDGSLKVENFYTEAIPTGLITCELRDAQFKESGNWQFEWQPTN